MYGFLGPIFGQEDCRYRYPLNCFNDILKKNMVHNIWDNLISCGWSVLPFHYVMDIFSILLWSCKGLGKCPWTRESCHWYWKKTRHFKFNIIFITVKHGLNVCMNLKAKINLYNSIISSDEISKSITQLVLDFFIPYWAFSIELFLV